MITITKHHYAVIRDGFTAIRSFTASKEEPFIEPVLCGYYQVRTGRKAVRQYLTSQGVHRSLWKYYKGFTAYRIPENFERDWLDSTIDTIREAALSTHKH